MILSYYTNDSGNVTSSCLRDIIFQVSLELRPLDLIKKFTVASQVSKRKLTCLALVDLLLSKTL